jgi:hypothetical protein
VATTPTTLQTLITAARLRVDMRTSQYLSDAEFTSHINASLAQLDSILISKFDDYKISSAITNVLTNTNLLALPNDFLKFRGLDIQYTAGSLDGYMTVRQHSFQQRNSRNYPGTAVSIGPYGVTYRLQGNNVVLLPGTIAGQYTYRLWYTPDFIQLINPTDTLQTYMDSQMWYDYAIVDTAAKVESMQNNIDTAQLLMSQAEQLRDHIIKLSAPNRDAGEPKAVVDTRASQGFDGGGGYGWNW